MDPSLSVSNDPHHPPPFTAFPPFTNSNSFVASNHPFFVGSVNPSAVSPTNNHHLFQVPPQTAPAPPHPPYSDMICTAIAALNEPDGSSKQAISRYIERIYTGIPSGHGALLTHHLKTLKNSGILMMLKQSYKLAANSPPASVAVAAAGLELSRSEFTTNRVNENQSLPDPSDSTTQRQKRGRGRPPKPKSDLQPGDVQTNGKPTWEENELPVSRPDEEIQPQPQIRRPPGRPRKDGSSPTVQASVSGNVEISKRRGRPPSVRAAGRERKPTVVSAPVSVLPYVANGGVRRRGRPKRVDSGASSVAPPPPPNTENGGAEVPIVIARRRGRPPKIGGVIRKPMKPKLVIIRTGRPRGRPRKNVASRGASGQQDIGYGELKKKFELFQEKAEEIVNVLKAEIGRSENQAVVQAIQKLEELTVTTKETPEEPQQHMEEVQPEEEHPETETEPVLERQGQRQVQTEAEAMQEALF